MSMAFNCTSTLIIDFYPMSPATATAANNLVRCWLGAGATAAVIPMVEAMGRGWTFTALTLFLGATSPMLWAVYYRGMGWREQRRLREESERTKKDARKAAKVVQEGKDDAEAAVDGTGGDVVRLGGEDKEQREK